MSEIKNHREIKAAAKMIADWRSMMIVHIIYEHGPIRYRDIDRQFELSPTVLSGRLAQLVKAGMIKRLQADGAKEVYYKTMPLAKNMVRAYHLLETVNDEIKDYDELDKGGVDDS